MIDEEETYEKFGYYSIDVKNIAKVIVLCTICNNTRVTSKGNALKVKRCAKCQRIDQCKKISNIDRFGRKHTEKTKQKISVSNSISQKRGKESHMFGKKLSNSHKEIIAKSNKERVWSKESIEKSSNSKKGKKASEETKAKMSLSQTGKNNPMYGKPAANSIGSFYQTKEGIKIWLRSSWEIKVANYLDSKNIQWLYEYTAFPIEYIYNNTIRYGTYSPDFYLPNIDTYWEIKGFWFGDSREKYVAFLEQYKGIKIILKQKEDLILLGINLKK